MRKNLILGSAIAVAAATFAQAQAPQKVAVIAIQQAIISTKEGQKAASELDAKTAPKKKEIEDKQTAINNAQDQLNKGQNTLSETAKANLYKDIETRKKNLQRDVQDAQDELDQDQQKILQGLGQKMMAVIEKYARDHGYTMVVDVSSPQSPILYASPSIDITKEIIDLYDQSAAQLSAPAATPKPAAPAAAPRPATPPPAAAPKPPAGK